MFLGVRNIRERKALATLFAPSVRVAPKPLRRIVREGFFVGATNPKGVIIFTAVLPQFVDRSQGHVTLQLASLGAICILIALLSDCAEQAAGVRDRARVARPLIAPARVDDRGRRRDSDRARVRPRADDAQELSARGRPQLSAKRRDPPAPWPR